jgi:hypothetical protein
MAAWQERLAVLGRGRALLAAYAVVIGAVSVIVSAGEALDGEIPAICRVVLGIFGVAAGFMLWTGKGNGLPVLIWAVLQIPVFAWNTHGSPTTQLIKLALAVSSKTTVNGKVTDYSQIGINLIGVILTVWAGKLGIRWGDPRGEGLPSAAATYEIEHRGADGAPHALGSVTDLEIARRAAASQATRLRGLGQPGEVVVVDRGNGEVVAREALT